MSVFLIRHYTTLSNVMIYKLGVLRSLHSEADPQRRRSIINDLLDPPTPPSESFIFLNSVTFIVKAYIGKQEVLSGLCAALDCLDKLDDQPSSVLLSF